MRGLTLRSRGQALVESTIALPVFLLVLFAIVWAMQNGVLGERVQLAARYGGTISQQLNPFDRYSLYAAYRAAGGSPFAAPCPAAPAGLVTLDAPFASPAPHAAPLWVPTANSVQSSATCGRTLENGGAMSMPAVLLQTQSTVSASSDVPAYLRGALGATKTLTAQTRGLATPDLATVIACYPELAHAFNESVNPGADKSAPKNTPRIDTPQTGALAFDATCGS